MRNSFYIILFCIALIGCKPKIIETPIALETCAEAPIALSSAAVFVLNNRAYILAGRTGADWSYSNEFYSYDPATNLWSRLEDLPFEGRSKMIAVTCNGVAYCGGGFAGDQKDPSSYKTDWWAFDGNTWKRLPNIPTKYTDGMIAFSINDKVYAGYGYNHLWSAELFAFDTKTQQWSTDMEPDGKKLKLGFGYAYTQNIDHIFAGLGFDSNNINRWSEYDSSTNSWNERTSLPGKGGVFCAATANSDKVFLAGGRAFGSPFADGMIYDLVWAYSITDNQWTLCAHLPQPTENMIAFTINGIPYFGLGEDADGNRLKTLYRLCVNTH